MRLRMYLIPWGHYIYHIDTIMKKIIYIKEKRGLMTKFFLHLCLWQLRPITWKNFPSSRILRLVIRGSNGSVYAWVISFPFGIFVIAFIVMTKPSFLQIKKIVCHICYFISTLVNGISKFLIHSNLLPRGKFMRGVCNTIMTRHWSESKKASNRWTLFLFISVILLVRLERVYLKVIYELYSKYDL